MSAIEVPFGGRAEDVTVEDAGGFYTATDVEGVLAEIAPQLVATPPFLGIPAGNGVAALGSTDVYVTKTWVPVAFTVASIAFRVGTQNGNMQVGIYDSAGNELYDSGSFAVPAVGARSHILGSPLALSAGWVYTAIQTSGSAQFYLISGGIGVGASFANTYGSGLPATLPALTAIQTPVPLTLHP